jgi:hypothetical protein
LAGLFTIVLTVAGCNSANPDPTDIDPGKTVVTSATPTTTPPATSMPSPSKVYKPASARGPAENVPVPVLPAAAKEFSKNGLEEFARYWYSTLGYVFETGDSKPMMDITDASCKTCANINGPVSDWYAKGGWIVGGQMIVSDTTSSFVKTPNGNYQAVLMVRQAPVSYYHVDRKLETALTAKVARADILVATYDNGRWTTSTAEHLTKN